MLSYLIVISYCYYSEENFFWLLLSRPTSNWTTPPSSITAEGNSSSLKWKAPLHFFHLFCAMQQWETNNVQVQQRFTMLGHNKATPLTFDVYKFNSSHLSLSCCVSSRLRVRAALQFSRHRSKRLMDARHEGVGILALGDLDLSGSVGVMVKRRSGAKQTSSPCSTMFNRCRLLTSL